MLTWSCTNLDVDVKSLYTEYPDTDVALEAKMADVYYCFRGALGRRYGESSSLSSDEQTAISFDGDYFDGGTYAHSAYHAYSADDASTGWYGDLSAGITKANQAILDLGGYDSPASSYARAMRAFYMFLLMDNYGDIPIIDKVLTDEDVVVREARPTVAQWLADELTEIIPNLTEEVNAATYGKPTKWMAEALLAKIYLNWPVYTATSVDQYNAASYSNEHLNDIVTLCDDIIGSGKFALAEGKQAFRQCRRVGILCGFHIQTARKADHLFRPGQRSLVCLPVDRQACGKQVQELSSRHPDRQLADHLLDGAVDLYIFP